MSNLPVYLDYNATAPLRPAAKAAMVDAFDRIGNPSSVHRFGRDARRLIEDARRDVARLAGARPEEVVFTSGGTEANAMALRCAGCQTVLASAIEHDSVLQSAAPDGGDAPLPATADGEVDLAVLERRLANAPAPALLSVMAVNNETGVVQPIADVVAIARRYGAIVHCDAVQGAGKLPLDFAASDLDLMSLSAHKLGGPHGVGALIVREGVRMASLLRGGGQERRRRAGTENVAGIAGFAAAARAAMDELPEARRLAALRDRLEAELRRICPTAVVYGANALRVANTTCVAMPGVPAETQVIAFDLAGIAVSAGSACSSGKVTASHVLQAMGAAPEQAGQAIRASLGWATAPADVDRFVDAWAQLYRRTAGHRDLAGAA